MKELDEKLRDYYGGQSLSDDRVEKILASAKVVRMPFYRQPGWIAAAAAIALLLVGVVLVLPGGGSGLDQRIAVEVAKNHSKALASEVSSESFARIQAALPRLDFRIAPTRPEMLAGLTVLGGRYCSIQGELAAQIALRDEEGRACTLYVAPLTEALDQARTGVREVDGVGVETWRDAHRLFVLAR